MFRKLLDEGLAGDNIGALLRGIDKEDVQRGQVLSAPGSITIVRFEVSRAHNPTTGPQGPSIKA